MAALSGWTGSVSIAYPAEWKPPPVIDTQACIESERFLGQNPLSGSYTDSAFITEYVEPHENIKQNPDKILDLVNGKYFTALIIRISRNDQNVRKVSLWILEDTKAEGKPDKAIYRETEVLVAGKETIVANLQATEEQIEALQVYYKKAVGKLSSLSGCYPGGTS